MGIFFSLVATGILLIFALSVVIPKIHTDGTFLAAPVRMMLGVAVLVCAMNVLMRFLPGVASAWIIVVVLCAVAALGINKRHFFAANRNAFLCSVVLIVCVLGWRLMTSISVGHLVPAEGTGNSDELWYIFSADWLQGHSLSTEFSRDPRFPLASSAGVNIGLLPRIGAESLLIFFSAISGARIDQVYPVLFAVASICFCFSAAQGFIDEAEGDWRFLPLSLFVVAISPVALFIFGNGNLATMWGLIFLGGYYWNMQRALFYVDARSSAMVSGVFLGALLATYPELLAIVLPSILIQLFQAMRVHRARWPIYVKNLASSVLVAMLVAPFAAFDTSRVLLTGAAAAKGPNVIFPDLFSALTPVNFLPTLLTFDTKVLGWFGSGGLFVGSALLIVTLWFVPKRVWWASAALLIASLLVLIAFWRQNYGYGGMKAIEFIALPASTLLGAAAGRAASVWREDKFTVSANGARCSPRRLALYAQVGCVMMAVLMLAAISIVRSRDFAANAQTAILSPELLDLKQARNFLGPDSVVMVGPELGARPFLISRWIAYVLRDVPLVYPPEFHEGGYIYQLGEHYQDRLSSVTHLIRARNYGAVQLHGAVWRNAIYELIPVGQIPLTLGVGFHGSEGWGRWMTGSAEIALIGACDRTLHITFRERFAGVRGEDAMIISAGSESVRYALKEGKGEIHFPLHKDMRTVTLRSVAGAKSPASMGFGDDRELSYAIEKIELAACAR